MFYITTCNPNTITCFPLLYYTCPTAMKFINNGNNNSNINKTTNFSLAFRQLNSRDQLNFLDHLFE